jgi:hypothetical protein
MSDQKPNNDSEKYFQDLQNAQSDEERHKIQTEWRKRISKAIDEAQSKPQNSE